jgi:hypothetical protein
LPVTSEERQRTTSIASLLREALSKRGDYGMIAIDSQAQERANAGFGYLFAHADEAADLARQFGADWIVVGRLQKSNALFAYLTVQLVHAPSERRVGEFYSEIKGPITNVALTSRGVQHLARQIDDAIRLYGTHYFDRRRTGR